MPDPKLYFSYLELPDGSKKYVKDIDAREEIAEVKETIKNGSKFIGKLVSAVVGGETVTTLNDGDVPTSITTDMGTYVSGTPGDNETALNNGDYLIVVGTGGAASLEFMWTGTKLSEFGSTSVLKGLAYKDNASGSYTPAGTNAPSAVTFTGGTDGDFVTGFGTDPVLPSYTEGAFSQGTLPSFTEGAFTPAEIQSGFYSAGTAASFTEGAFDAGSLPSKDADTWDAGSLPTFTEGAFSAGALASLTYDSTNEGLVFAAGTLPSKAADTFTQGSLPSYTEGTFNAGSLPSKAADSFTANTPTVVDVTKFDGGSKASDTFDAGTLPTKAADTFSAGTAPTLATGKAITGIGTAEAAAQTFTGTAATITVS